jgi:hypothetical protein
MFVYIFHTMYSLVASSVVIFLLIYLCICLCRLDFQEGTEVCTRNSFEIVLRK